MNQNFIIIIIIITIIINSKFKLKIEELHIVHAVSPIDLPLFPQVLTRSLGKRNYIDSSHMLNSISETDNYFTFKHI